MPADLIPADVVERRFRAMGSDAHVVLVGGDGSLLTLAQERIDDLERRWSRFEPESEISRLNASAGQPVAVSWETLQLLRRSKTGARFTDGRFDPTVLGDLLRAGYVVSYEELYRTAVPPTSSLRRGVAEIDIDDAAGTATIPAGVGVDPGGIGKGFAADLVVDQLRRAGAEGAMVSLGGDLRVDGRAPRDGGWVIDVEHPFRREPAAVVGLRRGAVATTSRVRRVLGPSSAGHHVIDPSTGAPARRGIASVTVLAAEGWQAEVVAKAAFVSGHAAALRLLSFAHAEGLLVDDDGIVLRTPGFDAFTPLSPTAA